MANEYGVKIEYGGGHPSCARVTDAETGKLIPNVTRVELVIDVNEEPRAIIHTYMPFVSVVVGAEMHEKCPYCGREVEQDTPARDG